MLAIEPFLTAYDPSDLPGGSIDPLGFERGYLLLADKLLPGLTNVANKPRYFSVLCAAIAISDERASRLDADTPRERSHRRLEAIQRAERFWTLACVLASRKSEDLSKDGIRGIRYVERAVARIDERGDTSTQADFRLLSRQLPYGMVGIYGSVADGLALIDRASVALGPDIGRRLADAFIVETEVPDSLRRAIAEEGTVGLASLTAWGKGAHVNAQPGKEEARVLNEALVSNDVRQRTAALLAAHPAEEDEHELLRLRRLLQAMASTDHDPDLREALRAIVSYETCYRLVLLAFQRLLWWCQTQEPYTLPLAEAGRDPVLRRVFGQVPAAVVELERALDEGQTSSFCDQLGRVDDVRLFLKGAASAVDVAPLVERLLDRHRDVQRAKLVGGRPKMPWLEVRKGSVALTLSSGMQLLRPPERPENVLAHPYRTNAVDNFRAMGTEG